jgi:hypothetical protein
LEYQLSVVGLRSILADAEYQYGEYLTVSINISVVGLGSILADAEYQYGEYLTVSINIYVVGLGSILAVLLFLQQVSDKHMFHI